jgi:hypothetical protein
MQIGAQIAALLGGLDSTLQAALTEVCRERVMRTGKAPISVATFLTALYLQESSDIVNRFEDPRPLLQLVEASCADSAPSECTEAEVPPPNSAEDPKFTLIAIDSELVKLLLAAIDLSLRQRGSRAGTDDFFAALALDRELTARLHRETGMVLKGR